MGLRAVLVDEARPRRPVGQPAKVDGTTITAPTTGEWVKVRLELTGATEERPTGQPPRTRRTPRFMCLPDTTGRCPFQATDAVDVRSAQFGEFAVKVIGEPTPIRKKRAVIGWEVPVERVAEQTPQTGVVA